MSGTRSAFLKVQATNVPDQALLIAAHGDRGGSRDNLLARRIARDVAKTGRFEEVHVGYVRGTPGLSEVAAQVSASRLLVYPLFMSNGYYVQTAIPQELGLTGERGCAADKQMNVMPPIGISKQMPDVVCTLARNAAREAGTSPADCSVLLVAHGSSKDDCSRRAAEQLAIRVAHQGPFRDLHTAYLEEAPFLGDQLRSLSGPLIVTGLFIGTGMHGGDDLAKAREGLKRDDVLFCPPLAHSPEFRRAILADLAGAD